MLGFSISLPRTFIKLWNIPGANASNTVGKTKNANRKTSPEKNQKSNYRKIKHWCVAIFRRVYVPTCTIKNSHRHGSTSSESRAFVFSHARRTLEAPARLRGRASLERGRPHSNGVRRRCVVHTLKLFEICVSSAGHAPNVDNIIYFNGIFLLEWMWIHYGAEGGYTQPKSHTVRQSAYSAEPSIAALTHTHTRTESERWSDIERDRRGGEQTTSPHPSIQKTTPPPAPPQSVRARWHKQLD